MRAWRTFSIAIAAVALLGAGVIAGVGTEVRSGEEQYQQLDELPRFAEDVDDIGQTAIALAAALGEPPVAAASDRACPSSRLFVSWEVPDGYTYGTYIEPVGPEPTDDDGAVNGVVLCEVSDYGFMGFEALRREDGRWELWAVPTHEQRDHDHGRPDLGPDFQWEGEFGWFELPGPTLDPDDVTDGLDLGDLGPIDPYAVYQPQRLCHPEPKPGAVALADILLHAFPETRNYGVSRGCDIGGRSEHKEGRAFDWGVNAGDPEERELANAVLDLLLATDAEGNEHALARRMGIMYIIWDGQIWSSSRPDEGWRPYRGADAHTDHVHFSLSWEGAMGRTSLWRALLGEGRLAALPPLDSATAPSRLDPPRPVVVAWEEPEMNERRRSRTAEPPREEPEDTDAAREDGGTDGGTDEDGSGSNDVVETTEEVVDDTARGIEETVDDVIDEVEETSDDLIDEVGNTIDDTASAIDRI